MTKQRLLAGTDWAVLGVSSVLFGAFWLYFYISVLPIVPYSVDDWAYLSQFRDMFPSPTRWNPARVFPEILQPFMGHVAAVWYAASGNYIDALIGSHALFLAIFFTALAMGMYLWLCALCGDRGLAMLGVALFWALAFSLFKSRAAENVFLFYSQNVTVTAFYVIPDILNSLLALYILYGQFAEKCCLRQRPLLAGLLFLGIFLAQFSMTYASAIASGLALLLLLWRWKAGVLARGWTFFDTTLLTNVVFWIMAALMDMTGGRYERINRGQWNFSAALENLGGLVGQCNIVVLVVAAALVTGTALRMVYKWRTRRWQERDMRFLGLLTLLSLCLCGFTALCVLISARADVHTGNIAHMYGIFFFVLLILVLGTVYMLLEMPRLGYVAPAVILLLLVEATNPERPWARGYATPEHRALVESWLRDVRAAEAHADSAVVIGVPQSVWPHNKDLLGRYLSQSLFAHGVTAKRLHITERETAPAHTK